MQSNYSAFSRGLVTPRFLPAALIQARAEVFNPLNCLDLNMTARRVLYGILTFVKIKQCTSSIFPRRELLRAESLVNSEGTLYRGLAKLEAAGYINRDQVRTPYNGKFHVSPITLTEKARSLLSIGEYAANAQPIDRTPKPIIDNAFKPKMETPSNDEDQSDEEFDADTDTEFEDQNDVIHSHPTSNVQVGYVKKEHTNVLQSLQNTIAQAEPQKIIPQIQKGLPPDLAALLSQDVKKSAICYLMRFASNHKKRLSDVVSVVNKNISTLRNREVVAYLKSMILKDIDYKWLAKQNEFEQAALEESDAINSVLAILDEKFNGYKVFKASGKFVGVFESLNKGNHIINTPGGSIPVNARFANAVLRNKLKLTPHE